MEFYLIVKSARIGQGGHVLKCYLKNISYLLNHCLVAGLKIQDIWERVHCFALVLTQNWKLWLNIYIEINCNINNWAKSAQYSLPRFKMVNLQPRVDLFHFIYFCLFVCFVVREYYKSQYVFVHHGKELMPAQVGQVYIIWIYWGSCIDYYKNWTNKLSLLPLW